MKHKKYFTLVLTLILVSVLFLGCDKETSEVTPETSNLLITPISITEEPIEMDDLEIIAMFSDTLYNNGLTVLDWIYIGTGIERDENTTLESNGVKYALIKNISSIDNLKANCEMVYSKTFLENSIYPRLIDGDSPLIIEKNGDLYYNTETGGVFPYGTDFTRAEITSKNENDFEIEVPMTAAGDDEGELFTYKVINQNDIWVLDNFYSF